ncbi:MAG: TolC family protein [Saprospiraceae bacterium]|jgi:hypothetical protein|nr:TolC family protein [Saprospiraceae bacterium]
MKKAFPLFACICLLVAGGFAQKMLTTDEVLAGARQDARVRTQAGHLEYARQVDPRLPFLNGVSLRTQTDRLELQRQRYTVRISTNGFREMRAARRYQQVGLLVAESRGRSLLHEALSERYELLITHRLAERELELYRQLLLVYEDKLTVLHTQAALGANADVEDVIEAEYDRDETVLRATAAEQVLQESRNTLVAFTPGAKTGSVLDTAGFLSANNLLLAATSLPDQALQHPELLEQAARVARVDAEFQTEKAHSQKLLDFVQVRHDNRPSEPLSRDISFAIGLNLPFRGASTYKMAELKIEKNAAEAELLQEQAETARSVQEARSQLLALDAQYRQAQQQLTGNQAEHTLRQAAAGVAADPMTLLRAKELLLKRRQRLLNLEVEMYARYLDLLDSGGYLSAEPLVNYLADRR